MQGWVTFFSLLAMLGLGYWAYGQTIETQHALAEVARLQAAIGTETERLSVLRAEWAYLNRPDRLRELADFNFERLGLLPLAADQFGAVTEIPLAAEIEALEAARSAPEGPVDTDLLFEGASAAQGPAATGEAP